MNQHITFRTLAALALSSMSVPCFAETHVAETQSAETQSAETQSAETPARADDEPPPSRKMNLSVAAPGAPVQRSDYLHEGFYLRFGVGPGFLTTNVNNKETDTRSSATDFSLGSELLKIGRAHV